MAADEIEYFRREIIECTRDCRRAEFTDVYQTESDFEARVEAEFNKIIDQVLTGKV
jgi:hypothetical protein